MAVLNRSNAPHYQWGDDCDGWRLLDKSEMSVIEECMPAGTQEIRHAHSHARQVFYVLEGLLSMEINGTMHRLDAGDSLHIPPSTPHQARNDSQSLVRFLVISAPSTQNDRSPV